MTPEDLAKELDGREIGREVTQHDHERAKDAGLVIVFGASDDLIEFRGAIREEFGCYAGEDYPLQASVFRVDTAGAVARCDDESRSVDLALSSTIRAFWDVNGYSWVYGTAIHHATFDIMEDGEKYCRGMVFALSEVGRWIQVLCVTGGA